MELIERLLYGKPSAESFMPINGVKAFPEEDEAQRDRVPCQSHMPLSESTGSEAHVVIAGSPPDLVQLGSHCNPRTFALDELPRPCPASPSCKC